MTWRGHAARMTPHLHDLILRRLTSTGADQQAWSLLILAALESPESLNGCLAGTQSPAPAPPLRSGATPPARDSFAEGAEVLLTCTSLRT
jgi:hypothetical protein